MPRAHRPCSACAEDGRQCRSPQASDGGSDSSDRAPSVPSKQASPASPATKRTAGGGKVLAEGKPGQLSCTGEATAGQAPEKRSRLWQGAGGRRCPPPARPPGRRSVTGGDTTFPNPQAAPLHFSAHRGGRRCPLGAGAFAVSTALRCEAAAAAPQPRGSPRPGPGVRSPGPGPPPHRPRAGGCPRSPPGCLLRQRC